MTEAVEILVPEQSRGSVEKHLGVLPHVRFVSEASDEDIARILVARLHDLGKSNAEFQRWIEHAWQRHAAAPLVFLQAGGKSSVATHGLLQAMALVSERAAPEAGAPYVAPNREAARRVVLAHGRNAEKELIASASLEDGMLWVWSCEPRLYRCRVADIPAIADLSKRQLERFEVSSSGSRLHWLDADVDLNLETIRTLVDPEYRAQAKTRYREEASLYARAIRTVREKHGLRQGDIEGLSERQVRRLEQGHTFPQAKTVEKLATAHGLSVAQYLKELARHSKDLR